jgi:hypothetical protein
VAGIGSIALFLVVFTIAEPAIAARLKSQTVDVFGRYVQLS